MVKRIVTSILVVASVVLCFGFVTGNRSASGQEGDSRGQYAPVNGLELYYEVHGAGEPLILLHGGLGTIDMLFGQLLPALAETRQVIAVELQGHGHTADIDRPLSFELMADDVAALIAYLGLENADIVGFSLGGGVALQTAFRHPESVRNLVLISAPFRRDGWYPEVLAGMAAMDAEAMVGSPLHQFYAAAAPKPEDWPTLVAKSAELTGQHYDWSADVAAIAAPTLIIVGDMDNIRPAHAVELFGLRGGGLTNWGMPGADAGAAPAVQLAVLPGTDHFTILSRTDLLLPILLPFLDASTPNAQ